MKISAQIKNRPGHHVATVRTNENEQQLSIPPKAAGAGSSVNGGELLFLALATCYCNDIYREAAKQGIEVEQVEVTVSGEFGGPGDPARNISYHAKLKAMADEQTILALLAHTDAVAEVQNTLRQGVDVKLIPEAIAP